VLSVCQCVWLSHVHENRGSNSPLHVASLLFLAAKMPFAVTQMKLVGTLGPPLGEGSGLPHPVASLVLSAHPAENRASAAEQMRLFGMFDSPLGRGLALLVCRLASIGIQT